MFCPQIAPQFAGAGVLLFLNKYPSCSVSATDTLRGVIVSATDTVGEVVHSGLIRSLEIAEKLGTFGSRQSPPTGLLDDLA